MTAHDTPRLLADIGGTYARFALETAPGHFVHARSLRTAEHADFHAAVSAYLAGSPSAADASDAAGAGRATVRHAAVAVANPVEGDQVRMTNYPWQFSIEEMRERLGLETLVVVNDFTALAMALPRLPAGGRRQVGGGAPVERSVIGVIGSGTGLGVSGLIPADEGWIALGTEGGHVNFGPRDAREALILRHAERQFEHVSYERLLSGPGIELIHRALCERDGAAAPAWPAPEITRLGLAGADARCAETLQAFCAMLGSAAANLAVTLGARGGVYIGGGIVPRLGLSFDRSPFRARFEDKGRFSDYMRSIPTYVVTAEHSTFIGLSTILASQLQRLQRLGDGGQRPAIVEQIRRSLPNLSPAERRVAEHVIAHPHATLNDPIARIARVARVSQPSVIRFCRTLGCEGLSDFKRRLASGLAATVPITHTQVTGDDSTLELGVKVLSNTAGAVLRLREQLNREVLTQAIEVLAAARRVDFFAVGTSGVVAVDAQYKFLRFGTPTASVTDRRLLPLAAAVMGEGDVAVLVSSSGEVEELLEVADIAAGRGARVLAITAAHSPLARKADVALIVDHAEDLATHVPMVSRILHLVVIDILAVGVAMMRGDAGAPAAAARDPAGGSAAGEPPDAAERVRHAGPGIRTAAPLAGLTSHSR